jgi:general secretion pathway protein K
LSWSSNQRGVALLVVLWACTLLAIMVGGYASLAHVEGEQTRNSWAQSRARYAAEAGITRAIYEVYTERVSHREITGSDGRWIGDGKPYPFTLDDAHVMVSVEDEIGKVDLNTADLPVITGLIVSAGVVPEKAKRIASEIDVWRSEGAPDSDAVRRYQIAGRSYGPRRGMFPSIEELQAVLGVDGDLYSRMEPALTVWGRRTQPVAYFASPLALTALPGVDLATAQAYITQRDSSGPGVPLPFLPGNVSGSLALGSNVVTIVSTGSVGANITAAVRATVRFDQIQEVRDPRRPLYTILRWQDVPRG